MDLKSRRSQAVSQSDGCIRCLIKFTCIQLVLQAAIFAVAYTAVGPASARIKTTVSKTAGGTKMDYCKTCHGQSGQGFRGYYPIPRLAGQQTEYSLNQLKAFVEHRRKNNIMFNVAHDLDSGTLTALAKQFNGLNPNPLGGAPKQLIPAGKKIYEEGIPESSVPPCSACHGADAKGREQFPRLAGQLHDYIFNKLTSWSKERGQDSKNPDISAVMEPIAHSLTEAQIRAVAAYVSYLK
jgi:cytochrome c553